MGLRPGQGFEHGFRLDALRIDPQTGEVAGPGGRETLDPKVMDTLLLMAERAGQVVSREDLYERLWPDTVVSDDALTRCFSELRRQLSRAGGDERYRAMFETLPKRGYRLNAAVLPLGAGVPAPAPARPRALPIAVAAAVLMAGALAWFLARERAPGAGVEAEPVSIAVLPFADMSETQDQAYLADGVAEEILNRLAASGDLRVTARTSSFVFRGETTDIAEIARRLNVTHVLEGSVRRSGDRVRVTAQLIAADDSSHLWSTTYDRQLGDLFLMQDEIAASVAEALAATFVARDPQRPRTEDVAAFVELTRGNFFYYRRAEGDIERSVEHYLKAVEIDPEYARAWAALAGAYGMLAWPGRVPEREIQARQGEAAMRAVELDPGLAVAQARLAQYYSDIGDEARSEQFLQKALALDPEEPLVLGFRVGRAVDRDDIQEAIRLQQRMVARDPMALIAHEMLALLLMLDGRYEQALAELRSVREINPDIMLDNRVEIARSLILLRRYDEALEEIGRLPEGRHRDQCLALLFQAPGRRAEADAALARLAPDGEDLMQNIRIAEAHAFRGDRDRAFQVLMDHRALLDRAAQVEGVSWIWQLRTEARLSPFLKPLQQDPRWAKLMARPAA